MLTKQTNTKSINSKYHPYFMDYQILAHYCQDIVHLLENIAHLHRMCSMFVCELNKIKCSVREI